MSKFSASGSSSSPSANILCIVGIIAVAVTCGVVYIRYNPTAQDIPPVPPVVYSTAASLPAGDEADTSEDNDSGESQQGSSQEATAGANEDDAGTDAAAANIPRDEWYMRLVNFDNLLEDDFATDVVEVGNDFYFDERAATDLQAFIAAANGAGMDVRIVSGSRSWENQQARYEARINELVEEGLDEDTATAQAIRENELPVASEHILSLGVDILPENNQDMDETLLDEPAYHWLREHAHEYGFIQRYPIGKGNITGIEFEPWHFRFVGLEQAALIYESGLTLEEYLA